MTWAIQIACPSTQDLLAQLPALFLDSLYFTLNEAVQIWMFVLSKDDLLFVSITLSLQLETHI